MMTKKDFETLAGAVRANLEAAPDPGAKMFLANSVVPSMAAALAQTNPRFDIDRFVQACLKPEVPREVRYVHLG